MAENTLIVEKIVEGIQELKGKHIVVVDMTQLPERACDYFVICEGNSSTHVASIADSIKTFVQQEIGVKPFAVDGRENSEWIVFDYGQVLAHVFQPEARAFYDIEHLWADARINEIPDLD
ncbi:MAG: ribosome silencing factor [Prevotellaceae bacterium]|jgi:ribosome-associated protein|nr:ribosome silencing factor [Prevotellaceae bacterium]